MQESVSARIVSRRTGLPIQSTLSYRTVLRINTHPQIKEPYLNPGFFYLQSGQNPWSRSCCSSWNFGGLLLLGGRPSYSSIALKKPASSYFNFSLYWSPVLWNPSVCRQLAIFLKTERLSKCVQVITCLPEPTYCRKWIITSTPESSQYTTLCGEALLLNELSRELFVLVQKSAKVIGGQFQK